MPTTRAFCRCPSYGKLSISTGLHLEMWLKLILSGTTIWWDSLMQYLGPTFCKSYIVVHRNTANRRVILYWLTTSFPNLAILASLEGKPSLLSKESGYCIGLALHSRIIISPRGYSPQPGNAGYKLRGHILRIKFRPSCPGFLFCWQREHFFRLFLSQFLLRLTIA